MAIFGYQVKGGNYSNVDNYGPYRCAYTTGGIAGTADSITCYFFNNEFLSLKYKFAIYSGNNIIANGVTNEGTLPSRADGWYTQTFPTSPSLSASTSYYLAVAAEKVGTAYVQIYYDAGDANQAGRDQTDYASTFPDPWSDDGTSARKYSIYCTYTEVGGGLSIPVATHHYGHTIGKIIRG